VGDGAEVRVRAGRLTFVVGGHDGEIDLSGLIGHTDILTASSERARWILQGAG
jgi:hypothetical protein